MKLVIIRHGQTNANLENVVQGAGVDLPLNSTGREQAAIVGKKLAELYNFPQLYCSEMLRAQQTAEIIAEFCNCSVKVFPNLEEVHFGAAEGLPSAEALRIYKDIFDVVDDDDNPFSKDVFIPGGESINQSTSRAVNALMAIKNDAEFPLLGVVTHGSLMFNLYRYFFDQPRRFENCDYFEVEL